MKHVALLELKVSHSFYKDGACPDLAFVPSPATESMLRKHRCKARYEPGRVWILAALDAAGAPVLPLPEGAALRFALEPRNADFATFTELSAGPYKAPLVFTNRAIADALEGDIVLPPASSPGEVLRPSAVAEVEIVVHAGGVGRATRAPTFVIPFESRKMPWAYYCVTNLADGGSSLHIVNASTAPGALDDVKFSDENRTLFEADQDDPDPDPIGVGLVRGNKGMRCVRFVSDGPVALRDEPRRDIELRLDAHCLARELPNPPSRRPSAIAIEEGGSFNLIEAQVQIIRYIAQTLETQN